MLAVSIIVKRFSLLLSRQKGKIVTQSCCGWPSCSGPICFSRVLGLVSSIQKSSPHRQEDVGRGTSYRKIPGTSNRLATSNLRCVRTVTSHSELGFEDKRPTQRWWGALILKHLWKPCLPPGRVRVTRCCRQHKLYSNDF